MPYYKLSDFISTKEFNNFQWEIINAVIESYDRGRFSIDRDRSKELYVYDESYQDGKFDHVSFIIREGEEGPIYNNSSTKVNFMISYEEENTLYLTIQHGDLYFNRYPISDRLFENLFLDVREFLGLSSDLSFF